MKKKKQGRKFSRERAQRKALLKSLAEALFLREKIKTTEARAKELKRSAEKLLTRSRKESLANRRYLLRFFSKKTVKKLLTELGPRYKQRPGGYTRLSKLPPRKTDGAKMAIIELIK